MTPLTVSGLHTRGGAAIPLQGVEVSGELLGGHARVRVCQRYRNTEPRPVEAVYTFPLPADATLTAFSMTCEGRRVQGVLKEREEAFRTYDDAITAGHGAALVDQERSNVFTAQVGNLLPNEETLVEVEFLQALQAEEGCVRWFLPTLVAPRYIPGAAQGDRTGHGTAEPTARVPDADRISPPIAAVNYGLTLELLVAMGPEVVVESPSHAIATTSEQGGVRVRLAKGPVALDRDLVLTVRSKDTSQPLTSLSTHRRGEGPGTFALTVVPDLLGMWSAPRPQSVLFVVDTSGSMHGESLPQAQQALRLCLRHLREADRFNIIAFSDSYLRFSNQPVPFTQSTLDRADKWVDNLSAGGGTEMLQPLVEAVGQVPDGVVVVLTDGQVGNEAEILSAVLQARKSTRVYSFGIGTNVSDALLRDLARQTEGAVEFIHPGERIDDKVVAQFSKALAPRVTGLQAQFEGVEAVELAPAELPPLVDNSPWTLFGRYERPGSGTVTLRGQAGAEAFTLRVPVSLPAESDRPVVEKLWAAERIRSWQGAALQGRRAQAMKDRILQLALAHGIVTPYTSFVVVEERTGDRRASGQAETRVVPVNAPAGWNMFSQADEDTAPQPRRAAPRRSGMVPPHLVPGAPPPPLAAAPALADEEAAAPTALYGSAAPPPPPAPAPAAPAASQGGFFQRMMGNKAKKASAPPPAARPAAAPAPGGPPPRADTARREVAERVLGSANKLERLISGRAREEAPVMSAEMADVDDELFSSGALPEPAPAEEREVGLLSKQLASGLWAGTGAESEPVRQARATALALLELLRLGITSSHALHGAQVKKAVEALLGLVPQLAQAPEVAELALGVAWLAASGPRTRGRIAQAAQPLASLSARLQDEAALRAHVDALAAR